MLIVPALALAVQHNVRPVAELRGGSFLVDDGRTDVVSLSTSGDNVLRFTRLVAGHREIEFLPARSLADYEGMWIGWQQAHVVSGFPPGSSVVFYDIPGMEHVNDKRAGVSYDVVRWCYPDGDDE